MQTVKKLSTGSAVSGEVKSSKQVVAWTQMACISIASSQKKCITLHFLSDNWISLTALFGLASRRIFTSKDASFTSQCRGVQPFFCNCGDVWAVWKLHANSELPSVQIIQALVTSELTCDCWAVLNTSNFENSKKCCYHLERKFSRPKCLIRFCYKARIRAVEKCVLRYRTFSVL